MYLHPHIARTIVEDRTRRALSRADTRRLTRRRPDSGTTRPRRP